MIVLLQLDFIATNIFNMDIQGVFIYRHAREIRGTRLIDIIDFVRGHMKESEHDHL